MNPQEKIVNMADFKQPARLKLVCSNCGADGEMQCGCGVSFVREANLTRKGDQVADALRDPANATKSDRVLAEELGVGNKTVSRARATVSNDTVEKRVGKDGKARKAPAPRINKTEEAAKAVKAATGEWPGRDVLSEMTGVSGRAADNALRTVKAVEEASGVDIANVTFTKAQDHHVEVKIRMLTRQLEKEYAAKHDALQKGYHEAVAKACKENEAKRFPYLQERENEASRSKDYYLKMMDRTTPIFTMVEYNDLLFCTNTPHPAGERQDRASMALRAKKLQLTGKK